MRSAGEDRRLAKAHLSVKMGGMPAAVEAYHNAPTPNVILLESAGGSELLSSLDELSGVCDPGTRVVVMPGGPPPGTATASAAPMPGPASVPPPQQQMSAAPPPPVPPAAVPPLPAPVTVR